MAIRGENVGTAYVRILADGDGLDRSIRDQMDDADWDSAGEDASKRWQKGWEREMKRAPTQRRLRDSVVGPLIRGKWLSKEFFKGDAWSSFRRDMVDEFGDAGERAADNLEKQLYEGMTFSGLRSRLKNITPTVVAAQKQLNAEMEREDREALAAQERRLNNFFRDQLQNHKRYNDSILKLNLDRDRELEAHWQRLADRQRLIETGGDQLSQIARDISRLSAGDRTLIKTTDDVRLSLRNLAAEMQNSGAWTAGFSREVNELEDRLVRVHPRIIAVDRSIAGFGDRVGRVMGRGSRSNILNFFGSLGRGMVNLVRIIPRIASGFATLGSAFTGAFSAARQGGAGLLSSALGGVVASARAAGPALAGFAAVAAGLGLVLGPLIGIISSLVGIVTALAASLTYALIGAIGAVGAVLVPFVGTILTAAGAFAALSDAQKEALKADVQPVVRAFKALGQSAADTMFANVRRQAERLAPILRDFQPLARRAGAALRGIGDYFLNMMEGPAFSAFRRELTRFLPDAMLSLGRSVTNFTEGFAGAFRASIPFMRDVLNWLEDITDRFSEWANSTAGQQTIRDFWNDVRESVKSVGNFLGAVGGLIAQLFEDTRGGGDTIFDDMAEGIRDATQWLKENPEAIDQWIEDAKALARDIGRIIDRVQQFIDLMDSPATRAAGRTLFVGIAVSAGVALAPITVLTNAFGRLQRAGQIIKTAVPAAFRTLGTVAGNVAKRVGEFFSSIPGRIRKGIQAVPGIARTIFNRLPGPVQAVIGRIVDFHRRLPGRIRTAINSIPGVFRSIVNRLPGIAGTLLANVVSHFLRLPGRVRGAVNSIPGVFRGIINNLPGIAGSIVGSIVGRFSSLPGRIRGAISGLRAIASAAFQGMVSAARSIPGQIVGFFQGLGGRIASAIGSISIPMPNIPDIPGIPDPFASGGLVGRTTFAMLGEAGPEAVVPLNRPLSQVDPSVRMLSAIAQGKVRGMASGGTVGAGKTFNVEQHIYSPVDDPRAVAAETVNRLVSVGY